MDETKYGKNILTELKTKVEAPWSPEFKPEEMKKVLFLDNEIIDGAFYVECAWFFPPMAKRQESDVEPHKHDYDEVLALFGTNLEDPHDLGGEVEVWLDDEKHIVTKSCLIFIPKGLQHGPIRTTRMDRPVFHFAVGTGKQYFN